MHPITPQPSYLWTYYCAYLCTCAALIAWLSWILRRSGRIFLNDAFSGNTALVRAVAQLLDIGFYLLSLGYVLLSYQTMEPMNDIGIAMRIVSAKVGGFLLLLGVGHLINLLLLALFRPRKVSGARAGV